MRTHGQMGDNPAFSGAEEGSFSAGIGYERSLHWIPFSSETVQKTGLLVNQVLAKV